MAQRTRTAKAATIVSTAALGGSFVRVVLGGGDLADFVVPDQTDAYVKIVCLVPGVTYGRPLDLGALRDQLPAEQLPKLRTYTVRSWDEGRHELTLDVLVHGDAGLGGPWAAAAQPGDEVLFLGPGGGYAPDPAAGWHLLAGDESALPAIAAALERIPPSATVLAYVEVADPRDAEAIADPRVTWVPRTGATGSALVEAVRSGGFPSPEVHAFVHGEAAAVRELRRYLRVEQAVPSDRLSISGYWRAGVDDEGWRAQKADWNRAVADDEAA